MEINWNTLGIAVAALVYLPLIAWSARKPLADAFARIRAMPRLTQATLCILAVIATLNAQKNRGGGSSVLSASRDAISGAVTPEEIARGYRLVDERHVPGTSFAMPPGATYAGRLHEHGGRSDFGLRRIDFGTWTFPCGCDRTEISAFWWFMDGRLQDSPRDPRFVVSAGLGDTLAVQGMSRMWLLENGGARTLTWERFFAQGDTNRPVNAQISLFGNGDFMTKSNDLVRVYRHINPDDWDGDGLDNTIDDDPYVNDGDAHGTGADWLNAQCGDVLAANENANGEISVEWIGNEDAYFWLRFTARSDETRIVIACESASDLGDMIVIADSNQVCKVPLLMGPRYDITASRPVTDITTTDSEAEIWNFGSRGTCTGGRGGAAASGPFDVFSVRRRVDLSFTGKAPLIGLAGTPDVGASFCGFSGGCCNPVFNGATLIWTCRPGCYCPGFSHDDVIATATWEGYTQTVATGLGCTCHEYNKEHPETWFEMSATPVVMLNGNMGVLSLRYVPYGEPSGTVTLRQISGAGKTALWADTNKTRSVTLPITWNASEANAVSAYIEGIRTSDEVDDIEFECVITGEHEAQTSRKTTVAKVKQMNVTSDVSGSSGNGPPFLNGEEYPFSVTNSPLPDKHLVIPFHRVGTLGENGFSVADFTVDMELELEPEGVSSAALAVAWHVDSALPAMSGSLVDSGGAAARFVNPKEGGVYRFRAEVAGASNTYANVVLPLCGAEVKGIWENDFAVYAAVISNLNARAGFIERQTPTFGFKWFNNDGAVDYIGRVDNAAFPTVWWYNQIDDFTGGGAIASLYGVPAYMAKLGNLLAGYGTEKLGVWRISRWFSQIIGTFNDNTATDSWDTGTDIAQGNGLTNMTAALAKRMWVDGDNKVKSLWPNTVPADNHVIRSPDTDFNRNFCSPGVVEGRTR